jgi:hypothetical protein
MFYGLISDVQLSYGITQGDYKHSRPYRVTLWATIASHLWAKMVENGSKQVYDDTYLHNLLFYTQICSMGQQVVFNYPMVSPKVSTTLMTLYSYPMGHHSHSFVSRNDRKRLKTGLWRSLLPQPLILYISMFYGPRSGVQLSYAITQGAYFTHHPK